MSGNIFDPAQNKAARIAGLAYLLTLAIVVISNYAISFRFIVPDDFGQTTRNILAHEQLFRLNAAFDLVYAVGIVVLLTALYSVLKPLGKGLALLAAFFRFVYALLWIVIALSLFSLLKLLTSPDLAKLFAADRVQSIAFLFLKSSSNAYTFGLVVWGLASTLCAFQLYGSGYVPKFLAIWGMIASTWCSVCGFGVVIITDFAKWVNPNLYDIPMLVFEIAIAILFLRRGVRPHTAREPTPTVP